MYNLKQVIRAVIGLAAMGAAMHSVNAGQSVCYNKNTMPGTTYLPSKQVNWKAGVSAGVPLVSVPKFDTTLGVLDSMTLTFSSTVTGSAKVENQSVSSGGTTTVTLKAKLTISQPPYVTTIDTISPSISTDVDLTVFDNNIDFGGSSGTTLNGLSGNVSDTLTKTVGVDDAFIANFTNNVPDNATIGVLAQGTSEANGGGVYSTQFAVLPDFEVEVCYYYHSSGPCCIDLTKTASVEEVGGGEAVVYTYAVTNCGPNTLTNVKITDDNGTPGNLADDVNVATIGSLAPGAGQVFTKTLIPSQPWCMTINGVVTPVGYLFGEVLPGGDVKITYRQSRNVNDNTYGTGAVGWPNGHTWNSLLGSDKAEFVLYNGNGTKVFDGFCDYITATTKSNLFPSGFTCLGFTGGDGSMVSGFYSSNVISATTTLDQSINKPGLTGFAVNSPLPESTYGPLGWEYVNGYEVVFKGSMFGPSGYGHVEIPIVHNSPSKKGFNAYLPKPCDTCITNTAVAVASCEQSEDPITASATAVVCVTGLTPGGGGGGGNLPSPWLSKDIGTPKKAGSATYAAPVFTIKGSGDDIGKGAEGKEDEFQYVYQPASGDCTIVARVLTIEKRNDRSMGGVMIRETLDKGSKHETLVVTAAKGLGFISRSATNGKTTTQEFPGYAVPYWVKVERVGDVLTAYRSADGISWTSVGSRTIVMGTNVYIGLAVCSHKGDRLSAVTFDNVTATP